MKIDTQESFRVVNKALDELNKIEGRIFAYTSNQISEYAYEQSLKLTELDARFSAKIEAL
jgi:hypothetical protein